MYICSPNTYSAQTLMDPLTGVQAELPLMQNARSNIKMAMQEGATVTLGQLHAFCTRNLAVFDLAMNL